MASPMRSAPAPQPRPTGTAGAQAIGRALATASAARASDVHVRSGQRPWIRRGGRFSVAESHDPIPPEEMTYLKSLFMQHANDTDDLSITVSIGTERWRLTMLSAEAGESATFRAIPSEVPSFAQLGLPNSVKKLTGARDGLIIVAGATGSGKTTTVACLIDMINKQREAHILTIEDPVEYRYSPGKALISQMLAPGEQADRALSLAMRADPDVILMGECITASHFEGCMRLASTGHLVLTTVHARNAVTACERIATTCGENGRRSLSETLRAVISQQLVPSAEDPSTRFLASEVLFTNTAVRNALAPDGKMGQVQMNLENTNSDFDYCLANLASEGKISVNAARLTAISEVRFEESLAYLQKNRTRSKRA